MKQSFLILLKDFVFSLKGKKIPVTMIAFAVLAAIAIVIGVCACKLPVVAICVLVILEAGIAVMLHHAELWLHGGLMAVELIAGIIAGKLVPVLLCVLVYVAAVAALQVLDKAD